jgi:hypothetical protein
MTLASGVFPRSPTWISSMDSEQGFVPRVIRLTICLATGVIISATTYICAWLNCRDHPNISSAQDISRVGLKATSRKIEEYQKKTGHLPGSLEELGLIADDRLDSWGRPFQYQVNGDTYDLYSLGQDGVPGGYGLDADLHLNPADDERLTLAEFTSLESTSGIKFVCLLTGILAFPLCLLGTKRVATSRLSWGQLVVVLCVYLIAVFFACWFAGIMAILHVPSGH